MDVQQLLPPQVPEIPWDPDASEEDRMVAYVREMSKATAKQDLKRRYDQAKQKSVIDQVTRFAPVSLTLQGTNQAGVMETSTFTTQDSGWPTKCERAGPRPCTHTVTLSTATWADVRTVVLSDVMPG